MNRKPLPNANEHSSTLQLPRGSGAQALPTGLAQAFHLERDGAESGWESWSQNGDSASSWSEPLDYLWLRVSRALLGVLLVSSWVPLIVPFWFPSGSLRVPGPTGPASASVPGSPLYPPKKKKTRGDPPEPTARTTR